MSNNNINSLDEDNESVVEQYSNLISDLEKHGQDTDELFSKFGGKSGFLQFVQDLEDDVVNDFLNP